MAGRLQHYIPQMLLRRFANEKAQVKLHHKDGRSFPMNVKNAAAERDFLGEPGPGTPDESLSDEENRIAPLLREASESELGAFSVVKSAYLLAHFTTRLRSLRNYLLESGKTFLQEFDREYFGKGPAETIRAVVERGRDSIREEFDKQYRERLGTKALKHFKRTPQYAATLRNLERHMIQNPDGESIAGFRSQLLMTGVMMDRIAENAHKKVALTSPTPPARRKIFEAFTYEIREAQNNLILGDSVAWGINQNGETYPLHSLSDDMAVVVMPIALDRYLIGWKGDDCPDVGAERLRTASAECSESFIITHPEDAAAGSLREFIAIGHKRAFAVDMDSVRMSLR